MSKAAPILTLNNVTWGSFMELTRKMGVRLESTRQGSKGPVLDGQPPVTFPYLVREINGEKHAVPLPADFSHEKKMGPYVVENACRRLGIDLRELKLPIIL